MSDPLVQLFSSIKCSSGFPNYSHNVIHIHTDAKIPELFKKLIDSKILAVPVLDPKTNEAVSLISMVDLLDEFVKQFSEEELAGLKSKKTWEFFFHFSTLKEKKHEIENEKVAELLEKEIQTVPRLDPAPILYEDATLLDAAKAMVAEQAHRVLVKDRSSGSLITVITQSRIMEFLIPLLSALPEARKTISELGIGTKPVVTIEENEMAIKAFKVMKEQKVSAVAVVNKDGNLVGTISVNDLKLLGYDLKYFDFLEASVKDYITMVNQAHALQNTKSIRSEILLNHAKKHPGQPFIVTCSKDTSLGLVIKDMNYFKIHRIFVTENEKPVGVISQLDVIKKLLETRV